MTRNVNININLAGFRRARQRVAAAALRAINDCTDDIVRTSSETAPHDKGILDKSFAKEVTVTGSKVEGTVEYSVRETYSRGNFNYALKMHEGSYNLGPGSLAKPGGTGMSGKHYPVGPKFLTRPLEGEKEIYKNHIEEEIQRELE